MLLFIISAILVISSSYLLASCYYNKKFLTGFLYTILIAFAQVVLSVEILSLFGAISKTGILVTNSVFWVGSFLVWKKYNRPLWVPETKIFIFKILKAFKEDKILGVMGIGLLFFAFISIVLSIVYPAMAPDSLSYHLNRALFWASNGSLNHFDIADSRNLVMAINSEILYCWFFTFVKRNALIGLFSFVGYLFTISTLWSILEQLGYNLRKRLWTVFVFSALAGVVIEASGSEMNVVTAGLMLSGVNLFLLGSRKNVISAFFFSALSFALAIGTKSTALFISPVAAIICLYILQKYRRYEFWNLLVKFAGFFAITVVLFASYNYILNFLHFGNFLGSPESIAYHRADGSFKGFLSGLIRHFVLLFDFTGFRYSYYLQNHIFELQDNLLKFLNIPTAHNVISSNLNSLNNRISDPFVGGGVIGVVVFLPCLIFSAYRAIFKKDAKNCVLLGLFGFGFILNVVILSMALGYMVFSSRFILSFIVFASPIFVLSYIKSNKNILKYLILFYVMSYFLAISTHIWSRHFINLTKSIKAGSTIAEIRHNQLCKKYFITDIEQEFCTLRSYLYKQKNIKNIALFTTINSSTATIKFMEKDGYSVDTLLMEKFENYDLEKYDIIVLTKSILYSSYVENKQELLKNYDKNGSKVLFSNPNKPKCILMDIDDILVHRGNLSTNFPTNVVCVAPHNLLEQKGFKLVYRIQIPKLFVENNKPSENMLIYKNINR